MLSALTAHWWVLLLRGIVAVLFGLVLLLMPGVGLLTLVYLVAFYFILDGVLGLWLAFGGRGTSDGWWLYLLYGLLGIGAGVLAIFYPGVTAVVLLALVAAWAVVGGIFEIVAAIRLRKEIENEWLLGLSGLLSVLFGVALMAWPASGLLALVWLVGAYAIAYGVILIALSFRVRSFHKRLEHAAA